MFCSRKTTVYNHSGLIFATVDTQHATENTWDVVGRKVSRLWGICGIRAGVIAVAVEGYIHSYMTFVVLARLRLCCIAAPCVGYFRSAILSVMADHMQCTQFHCEERQC